MNNVSFLSSLFIFQSDIGEWLTFYWISFAVLCLSALVYVFWASGEVQSWNNDPDEDNWLKRLKHQFQHVKKETDEEASPPKGTTAVK